MPLFNVGNEFKDRYRSHTSEHLIKIATTEKNKHSQETVDAAEAILRERGIDPHRANQRQPPVARPATVRQAQASPASGTGFNWRWIFALFIIIRLLYGLCRAAQHG